MRMNINKFLVKDSNNIRQNNKNINNIWGNNNKDLIRINN